MLKIRKPVARKAVATPPTGDWARVRRCDVAYDVYTRNAVIRFDLESKTQTIRQQRALMSLREDVGEYAMLAHVRDILDEEHAHQIELARALGVGPDGRVSRE